MLDFEDRPRTFLEHFRELRRRVIVSAAALFVGSVAGYITFAAWSRFLLAPVLVPGAQPVAFTMLEAFVMQLRVSLYLGILYTSPFLVYQVVAFVFPALTRRERMFVFWSLAAGAILFGVGVVYGYHYILPVFSGYLQSVSVDFAVRQEYRYADTLMLVIQLLLAFGLTFEFPLVLFLLMAFGLLRRSTLTRNTRWVIMICAVVAAVVTPPDPLSMALMAVPMVVLYFLTIGLAWLLRIG